MTERRSEDTKAPLMNVVPRPRGTEHHAKLPPAPRDPLERRTTFMLRWDVIQDDILKAQPPSKSSTMTPIPSMSSLPSFRRGRSTRKSVFARNQAPSTFFRSIRRNSLTEDDEDPAEILNYKLQNDDVMYENPLTCIQKVLSLFFTTQQGFVVPSSEGLVAWSFLIGFAMLYILLIAPMRLATNDLTSSPPAIYVVLDVCTTLIFISDIIIQFHLGVVNPRTREEDIERIRHRYIHTRIIRDVLGCIPVEILAILFTGSHQSAKSFFRFLGVLRLSRGTHVLRLETVLAGELFNFNRGVRRLIVTVVFVPLLSHLAGCLWLFLSNNKHNPNEVDSWWEIAEQNVFNYVGTSVDKYMASILWSVSTLTTVGFGEFTGANSEEYFISCLTCVSGSVISGILIAQTSSIVQDMNEARHQIELRMHSLRAYLRYRRVPKELQIRLLRYFRHLYERRAHFDEKSILESMTSDLRRALSLYLLEDTLQDLDIFRGISDTHLVARLLAVLKPMSITSGTIIIRKGEPVTEMYFIVRGTVEVLASELNSNISPADSEIENNTRVIATLGAGNHFGELSLGGLAAKRSLHLVTVRAITSADLFSLSQQHLIELAQKFPVFKTRLESFKKHKEAALKALEEECNATKVVDVGDKVDLSSLQAKSSSGKRQNIIRSSFEKLQSSFKHGLPSFEKRPTDDSLSEVPVLRSDKIKPVSNPTRNSIVYTNSKTDTLALLSVNMNLATQSSTSSLPIISGAASGEEFHSKRTQHHFDTEIENATAEPKLSIRGSDFPEMSLGNDIAKGGDTHKEHDTVPWPDPTQDDLLEQSDILSMTEPTEAWSPKTIMSPEAPWNMPVSQLYKPQLLSSVLDASATIATARTLNIDQEDIPIPTSPSPVPGLHLENMTVLPPNILFSDEENTSISRSTSIWSGDSETQRHELLQDLLQVAHEQSTKISHLREMLLRRQKVKSVISLI